MFKTGFLAKDSIWTGIALGIVVPGVFYALVFVLMKYVTLDEHTQSFLFILGVGLNLVFMRLASRDRKEQILKGILLVSFLLAIVFFFYKLKIAA